MTDEEKMDVPEDAPKTVEAEAPAETTETLKEASTEAAEASVEEKEAPAEEVAPAVPAGQIYKTKLEGFDEIKPGQTIRLHERIQDVSPKGEPRERTQVFEGMILSMGGSGISRTVTLRKSSGGIGVEKIYPINSPVVVKIELVKTARVRRAKLNFLKNLKKRFKRKLKETHNK